MKVLVLEGERGVADEAARNLQAVGHEVFWCHEPGERVFPCGGLVRGSTCPLVSERIEVALTVRSEPDGRILPLEDGVACVLRCHVPLVVAGAPSGNPYEGLHTLVVDGDDVVGACEQAARSTGSDIGRAASVI